VITTEELLDGILGLAIFFGPSITAFALVAFSPLRRLRQSLRFFAIGCASGVVAALLVILATARGTVNSQSFLFIVGISTVIGAVISLLVSSDTFGEKI
jgi:hypothetical protein